MSLYISNIKSAIIIFPVLAILLTIPLLIIEYRHYGSFTFKRAFVLYTMIFYLLAAYLMVILPLPSFESVLKLTSAKAQLIPFNFVHDFLTESGFALFRPATWVGSLKTIAFLQPVFNILLIIPFGFYLRYYFRLSFKQTIILSFFLSFFFELTQLSGLYWLYPRSYRLFDVDDLMMNTLGGTLGWLITPLIAKIFPNRDKLDSASYRRAKHIGWLRRLVALFIDYMIVSTICSLIIETGFYLIGHQQIAHNPFFNYILPIAIALILVPVITDGQTFGKSIVHIKITNYETGPLSRLKIALRQGMIYYFTLPICLAWIKQAKLLLTVDASRTKLNAFVMVILSIIVVGFVLDFLAALITRRDRLFYDLLVHTKQQNTLKKRK